MYFKSTKFAGVAAIILWTPGPDRESNTEHAASCSSKQRRLYLIAKKFFNHTHFRPKIPAGKWSKSIRFQVSVKGVHEILQNRKKGPMSGVATAICKSYSKQQAYLRKPNEPKRPQLKFITQLHARTYMPPHTCTHAHFLEPLSGRIVYVNRVLTMPPSTLYRSFWRRIHRGSLAHLPFSNGWPATLITPSSHIVLCSVAPKKITFFLQISPKATKTAYRPYAATTKSIISIQSNSAAKNKVKPIRARVSKNCSNLTLVTLLT